MSWCCARVWVAVALRSLGPLRGTLCSASPREPALSSCDYHWLPQGSGSCVGDFSLFSKLLFWGLKYPLYLDSASQGPSPSVWRVLVWPPTQTDSCSQKWRRLRWRGSAERKRRIWQFLGTALSEKKQLILAVLPHTHTHTHTHTHISLCIQKKDRKERKKQI